MKEFGDCSVWLHMMSEVLSECLRMNISMGYIGTRFKIPGVHSAFETGGGYVETRFHIPPGVYGT